jgi:predicted DNA-binding transcriptional regulator AlpA
LPKEQEKENLLLDTRQVAKLLKFSERTVWTYSHSGQMPRPIKIGSSVRWSAIELRRWVEAGCPAQEDAESRNQ